jgi:hypothetical protein
VGPLGPADGLFGPAPLMEHPTAFHASAGLVASAPELAPFVIALEESHLLADLLRDLAARRSPRPATRSPTAWAGSSQECEEVTLARRYGHWFDS